MAKNLKQAIAKNENAAADLNRALRDCIAAIKDAPQSVAQAELRLVAGRDVRVATQRLRR